MEPRDLAEVKAEPRAGDVAHSDKADTIATEASSAIAESLTWGNAVVTVGNLSEGKSSQFCAKLEYRGFLTYPEDRDGKCKTESPFSKETSPPSTLVSRPTEAELHVKVELGGDDSLSGSENGCEPSGNSFVTMNTGSVQTEMDFGVDTRWSSEEELPVMERDVKVELGGDDSASENGNGRGPARNGSVTMDTGSVKTGISFIGVLRWRSEEELPIAERDGDSLLEDGDTNTHPVKIERSGAVVVKDNLYRFSNAEIKHDMVDSAISSDNFPPHSSLGELHLGDAHSLDADIKVLVTTPVEDLPLNIKKEALNLSTFQDKTETETEPRPRKKKGSVSVEERPLAYESFVPESKHGDLKVRVPLQDITCNSVEKRGKSGHDVAQLPATGASSSDVVESSPEHFQFDGDVRGSEHDQTPDPNLPAEEGTQKMYNCGVCSSTFGTLVELKKHVLQYQAERRKVKCGHCGKTFKQCSRLKIHMAIHTVKKQATPHQRSAAKRKSSRCKDRAKCIESAELVTGQSFLKCDRCAALFTQESDLSAHKLDHEREVFECNQCPASFADQTQLKDHIARHPENKLFECNICRLRFRYPCFLKSHMRTHTGEKPFQCKQCPATFCQMSGLHDHLHSHKDQVYKCNKCPAEFKVSARLKRHKRAHGDELLFRCKTCPAVFIRGADLQLHTKSHLIGPFKCEECDAVFKCRQYLRRHKKTRHSAGNGKKPNRCDQCSAHFASASNLRAHKFIHTGERPFKCERCPAAFTSKSTLVKHGQIHTSERPFKCDQCPADFKGLTHLTRHMRIHSGDKPYLCQHCPLAFSDPSARTSHEKVHTKEKPYKCDQCSAKFKHATNLTEHKRIHTGEKPYKCNLCHARFRQNSHLKTHKDIHSGLKDYKYRCDLCPVVCYSLYTLRNHMKGNHQFEGDL